MPNSSSGKTARPLNVAVVGLGFMGVTHLRAYLENPAARVAAVCDPMRLPVNGIIPGIAGNIKSTGDIHLGAGVKTFSKQPGGGGVRRLRGVVILPAWT